MVRQPAIRALPDTQCQVGEGILWCPRRQVLFWVDITGCALLSHDPANGRGQRWPLPYQPGCIALTHTDEIIIAMPDGLYGFEPADGAMRLLASTPGTDPETHRANDGATSRSGRFVFGTIARGDRSAPSGCLYDWAEGADVQRRMRGFHIVNGLAFSPDDRTAYLSDSYQTVQTIWAFDHDAATGIFTNRREFFTTKECAGRPDGACIDTDGCYWMAGVGGSQILRITPRGEIDFRIELPVKWPSKPCFGGPDLRTLFVTSLRLPDAPTEMGGLVIEIETDQQGIVEPLCTS